MRYLKYALIFFSVVDVMIFFVSQVAPNVLVTLLPQFNIESVGGTYPRLVGILFLALGLARLYGGLYIHEKGAVTVSIWSWVVELAYIVTEISGKLRQIGQAQAGKLDRHKRQIGQAQARGRKLGANWTGTSTSPKSRKLDRHKHVTQVVISEFLRWLIDRTAKGNDVRDSRAALSLGLNDRLTSQSLLRLGASVAELRFDSFA